LKNLEYKNDDVPSRVHSGNAGKGMILVFIMSSFTIRFIHYLGINVYKN